MKKFTKVDFSRNVIFWFWKWKDGISENVVKSWNFDTIKYAKFRNFLSIKLPNYFVYFLKTGGKYMILPNFTPCFPNNSKNAKIIAHVTGSKSSYLRILYVYQVSRLYDIVWCSILHFLKSQNDIPRKIDFCKFFHGQTLINFTIRAEIVRKIMYFDIIYCIKLIDNVLRMPKMQ